MKAEIRYAQMLIDKYGGKGTPADAAEGLHEIGKVAVTVLDAVQFRQWLADGWNKSFWHLTVEDVLKRHK